MSSAPLIKVTIFTAHRGVLTKTLSIDSEGDLKKHPPGNAGWGTARKEELPFTGLSNLIDGLNKSQCLIHGISENDRVKVTPQGKPKPGAISRTKEHFFYPSGPGLAMFDHDPDGVGRYFPPTELIKIIGSVTPEFEHTARLVRYSTSSNVYTVEGSLLSPPEPGYHCYFPVGDASDLPRFGQALFKRLWLAGYGHCRLSKTGSLLVRGPFDTSVFSPERCDFVAGAELGDGLIQKFPDPFFEDGDLLDTRMLPDLSTEEENRYKELVEAQRKTLAPEQNIVRQAYAVARSKETGDSVEAIRNRLEMAEHGEISAQTRLNVKSTGTTMSVAEMLEEGMNGEYVEDPTERTDTWALLYIDGSGQPVVKSFIHGQQILRIVTEDHDSQTGYPRFLPKLSDDAKLGDRFTYDGALAVLNRCQDASAKAEIALAIVHKFAVRIPSQLSSEKMMRDILERCEDMPESYASQLRSRLEWMVNKDKASALKLTSITSVSISHHDYRRVARSDLACLPVNNGVTIVKAPHGAGKTQYLGVPFRNSERTPGEKFLAICHRQTLATELSLRLDCHHYQDVDSESAIYCDAIATCINSLTKFDDNLAGGFNSKVDALYIDEFSQVRRHIATGSVNEAERARLLSIFKRLIRSARQVVVTDADISNADIDFLESCRPGERFKVFECEEDHREYSVTYEHNPQAAEKAFSDILARLAGGQNVIVATDSKKKAKVLYELVSQELPELDALLITADNKGEPGQIAFTENPTKESTRYGLVIHSPTISSGISINCDHFNIGFGLFCGAVPHSDALQMMRRARHLKHWHVTFDSQTGNVQRGQLADADQRKLARKEAHTGTGETSYVTLTELENLIEEVKAWEIASKSNCARNFVWMLENLRYQMQPVALTDVGSQVMSSASNTVDERHIEAMMAASDISGSDAEALSKMPDLTEEQVYRLKRYELKKQLCIGTPTREDIEFWNDGYGLSILQRYELAAGFVTQFDDGIACQSEKRFDRQIAEISQKILTILSMDPFMGHGGFTNREANEVVDVLMEKPRLYSFLGIAPVSIIYKRPTEKGATKFVINVLNRMGVKCRSVQKRNGGSQCRYILMNTEYMMVMASYAARRNGAADRIVNTGQQGGASCHTKRLSLKETDATSTHLHPLDVKSGNKLDTLLERHGFLPLAPNYLSVIAPDLFATCAAAKSYRQRHCLPSGDHYGTVNFRLSGQSGSPAKAVIDTRRLPILDDVKRTIEDLLKKQVAEIDDMPNDGLTIRKIDAGFMPPIDNASPQEKPMHPTKPQLVKCVSPVESYRVPSHSADPRKAFSNGDLYEWMNSNPPDLPENQGNCAGCGGEVNFQQNDWRYLGDGALVHYGLGYGLDCCERWQEERMEEASRALREMAIIR